MHRLVLCKGKEEYKECAQSFIDMHRLHGINSSFSGGGSSEEMIHTLMADGRFIFGSDKPVEQEQFRFLLNLLENTENTVYLSRTDLPDNIVVSEDIRERFVCSDSISMEEYFETIDCYIHFYDIILQQHYIEKQKFIFVSNPLKVMDKTILEAYDTIFNSLQRESIEELFNLKNVHFSSGHELLHAYIGRYISEDDIKELVDSPKKGADFMINILRLTVRYPALKDNLIAVAGITLKKLLQDIEPKNIIKFTDVLNREGNVRNTQI